MNHARAKRAVRDVSADLIAQGESIYNAKSKAYMKDPHWITQHMFDKDNFYTILHMPNKQEVLSFIETMRGFGYSPFQLQVAVINGVSIEELQRKLPKDRNKRDLLERWCFMVSDNERDWERLRDPRENLLDIARLAMCRNFETKVSRGYSINEIHTYNGPMPPPKSTPPETGREIHEWKVDDVEETGPTSESAAVHTPVTPPASDAKEEEEEAGSEKERSTSPQSKRPRGKDDSDSDAEWNPPAQQNPPSAAPIIAAPPPPPPKPLRQRWNEGMDRYIQALQGFKSRVAHSGPRNTSSVPHAVRQRLATWHENRNPPVRQLLQEQVNAGTGIAWCLLGHSGNTVPARCALLGLKPGAGKTTTTVCTITALIEAGTAHAGLIIAPASLLTVWTTEMETMLDPDVGYTIREITREDLRNPLLATTIARDALDPDNAFAAPYFLVMRSSLLDVQPTDELSAKLTLLMSNLMNQLQLVVAIDEPQINMRLRNSCPTLNFRQAFDPMASRFPPFTILVSGTPLMNRGDKEPEVMRGHCRMQLPDSLIRTTPTPEQSMGLLKAITISEEDTGAPSARLPDHATHVLRIDPVHPGTTRGNGTERRLRATLGVGASDLQEAPKLMAAAMLAEHEWKKGQSVGIFLGHKEGLRRIVAHLTSKEVKAITIDGDLTDDARNSNIQLVTRGEEPVVFCATPQTAGAGHNFQKRCSLIIMVATLWSLEDLTQAIRRIVRPGQPKEYTRAYILQGEDPEDIDALEAAGRKRDQFAGYYNVEPANLDGFTSGLKPCPLEELIPLTDALDEVLNAKGHAISKTPHSALVPPLTFGPKACNVRRGSNQTDFTPTTTATLKRLANAFVPDQP